MRDHSRAAAYVARGLSGAPECGADQRRFAGTRPGYSGRPAGVLAAASRDAWAMPAGVGLRLVSSIYRTKRPPTLRYALYGAIFERVARGAGGSCGPADLAGRGYLIAITACDSTGSEYWHRDLTPASRSCPRSKPSHGALRTPLMLCNPPIPFSAVCWLLGRSARCTEPLPLQIAPRWSWHISHPPVDPRGHWQSLVTSPPDEKATVHWPTMLSRQLAPARLSRRACRRGRCLALVHCVTTRHPRTPSATRIRTDCVG